MIFFQRHMRIIERVQQIRDIWERWTNNSISAGAEHESRLNNFRKNRGKAYSSYCCTSTVKPLLSRPQIKTMALPLLTESVPVC